MARRPDFLCIGAQKSATTWLHANLNAHADVWLPPRKELHFFTEAPKYPSPRFGRGQLVAAPRAQLRDVASDLRRGRLRKALYSIRYLSSANRLDTYLRLFPSAFPGVRGEVTPAYSMLDQDDVLRVREALPDIKIIFLIRDPIERAWAQIRMLKLHGQELDVLVRRVNQPGMEWRGAYDATLSRWKSVVREGHLHVETFDRIRDHPQDALADVCRFLDIAAIQFDNAQVRVYSGVHTPVPRALEIHLARKYQPMLLRLRDEFDLPVTSWIAHADTVLASVP